VEVGGTTHAFLTFNFSAGTGFTPIGRDKTGVTQSRTTQFTDNLTWTRGKRTFKTGIDARRVRYADIESFLPSDDFWDFYFSGHPTSTALTLTSIVRNLAILFPFAPRAVATALWLLLVMIAFASLIVWLGRERDSGPSEGLKMPLPFSWRFKS
jgi:hypothetical protein